VSAAAHPLPEEPTPLGSRRKLDVVGRSPAVDLVRAERAVTDLLVALGQDPSSEQLLDTPRRVAATYAELLTPAPFTLTTFPNDEGYDELVLARAIPFQSLCQHHLLPFTGLAHVGYLPDGANPGAVQARPGGRAVRPPPPAPRAAHARLEPKGVGVVLEAEHLCMTLRGARVAGIYAAGDVAAAWHPRYQTYLHVEHWANALNQGPAAARNMLGVPTSYARLPYFYSDQYELSMEYSGFAAGWDRVVVRGDPTTRAFIAFWLKDQRVVAGMNANVWDVTEPIQTLIRSGLPVDPARLANPDIPLDQVTGALTTRSTR
jgi:GTP cyclohydrolase I